MKILTVVLLLCLCLLLPAAVLAQTDTLPTNIYAAGVSYNHGATPSLAGTGGYFRKLADTGTYAFTVADVLPTSTTPFTVTTNFGAGVAQKVATIAKLPIYVPTALGISWNGTNTGWQWSGGAATSIKVKGDWHLMPNVRFLRSNVSNGSGFQLIFGALVAWGK